MMPFSAARLVLLLGPALLLAACASQFAQNRQDLASRLQVQLAPDIAAGRVALQPLPDGTRVTLVEPSFYENGGGTLSESGRNILTSVIQALLDPALMRIDVTAAPPTPGGLAEARAQAVLQVFKDASLGPSLQPAPAQPVLPPGGIGATPPGVAIDLGVVRG
ncbi:conserved exported protein of unknown function [Rhodovastum atsumiense]|uniref:Uncharacterized protein n=1 Tax=Rhodovastum atsumiense TaxID=504468 RepID=A0A5M6J2M7_9PROT|nr:hypothetical protein [Rhodovastum atsumiense]KAA5613875.1 hypothetical protein F1189_03625 [Rhodovastum atsumiense]CAH2601997.1 conserved exported protein of unknown function [Rhodovastum atsumiense]